ncbi:MAG: hypothetical protein M3Z28_06035, partial [Candidatus Dormibacteraeota bacterium]|nr:hypothetical protein [Candidatus Dormibacteraeota bacterium]
MQVAGQGGIPSGGAAAVVLNVAVTNTTANGVLIAYPTGSGQPSTSNINFVAGQTISNLVQLPLGTSGQVALTSVGSSADLILDVEGYVAQIASGTAGLMNPLNPSSRICDTRGGLGTPCSGQTVAANGSLNIQVTGQGGIPSSGVQAVVMNAAVTNAATSGSLTVYPAGQAIPSTTNLNWWAGQTLSNRVVVPVGTGGQVTLVNRSGGSADFIVDVFAWTTDGSNPSASGSEYGAVLASRVCDTRAGSGTQCAGQTVQASGTLTIQVAGLAGVPSMSSSTPPTAIDVNVAATGGAAGG